MAFGLRCCQPARRPDPASLSIRVPTVYRLLHPVFSFTSRLRLAFRYGCRHRLRLAPFIQRDSAHAGHTGAGLCPASIEVLKTFYSHPRAESLVSVPHRRTTETGPNRTVSDKRPSTGSDAASQASTLRPAPR